MTHCAIDSSIRHPSQTSGATAPSVAVNTRYAADPVPIWRVLDLGRHQRTHTMSDVMSRGVLLGFVKVTPLSLSLWLVRCSPRLEAGGSLLSTEFQERQCLCSFVCDITSREESPEYKRRNTCTLIKIVAIVVARKTCMTELATCTDKNFIEHAFLLVTRIMWSMTKKTKLEEFCKCCEICQRTSSWKVSPAPLIPLPIITEPFKKVAVDIVRPLPRSKSGNL